MRKKRKSTVSASTTWDETLRRHYDAIARQLLDTSIRETFIRIEGSNLVSGMWASSVVPDTIHAPLRAGEVDETDPWRG